jgi:hypothetical protein
VSEPQELSQKGIYVVDTSGLNVQNQDAVLGCLEEATISKFGSEESPFRSRRLGGSIPVLMIGAHDFVPLV